jgi:hypothetical protein
MLTVSPFDGPNRIRFMGSLDIAVWRFPTADRSFYLIAFSATRIKSAIKNRQCPDSQPLVVSRPRLPRNGFDCQYTLDSRSLFQRLQPLTPLRCNRRRNLDRIDMIYMMEECGPTESYPHIWLIL